MSWSSGAWAERSWADFGSAPITSSAVDATLISAFNFCNPFDHVLPPPDAVVSAADRQHLWGLYSGILAGAPTVLSISDGGGRGGRVMPRGPRRIVLPPLPLTAAARNAALLAAVAVYIHDE